MPTPKKNPKPIATGEKMACFYAQRARKKPYGISFHGGPVQWLSAEDCRLLNKMRDPQVTTGLSADDLQLYWGFLYLAGADLVGPFLRGEVVFEGDYP